MTRSFNYGANVKGLVEIIPNGLETTYCFTVYDVQEKQRLKVSITCNNFGALDPDEIDKLNDATEKCDGSFEDWWKKYKEIVDNDQLAIAASLLPSVIAEFKTTQQRHSGKKLP